MGDSPKLFPIKIMTLKQKIATKNMVENGGNVSRAMIDAGYSPATANTPQKLTQSKGFEKMIQEYQDELIDLGINGKKLAGKTAEWLGAQKQISVRGGKDANAETDDFIEVPDYQTQLKAGEMLREDFGLKADRGVAVQINNIIEDKKIKYGF